MYTGGSGEWNSHPRVEMCIVDNKENYSGTVDDGVVVPQNSKQNYHYVQPSNIWLFYQQE